MHAGEREKSSGETSNLSQEKFYNKNHPNSLAMGYKQSEKREVLISQMRL